MDEILNLPEKIAQQKGFRIVLRKYRLESSANVQGVKKALLSKDIIDVTENGVIFNDALLKLWIKRNLVG